MRSLWVLFVKTIALHSLHHSIRTVSSVVSYDKTGATAGLSVSVATRGCFPVSCVRPRSPVYMGVRGLLLAWRVSHLAGSVVCFDVLCTDSGSV